MKIIHPGSTPTADGPADWFSGHVRLTSLVDTPAPARLKGTQASFEAGARTAWHTHPLGQTLFVVSGVGRVAVRGEAPRIIRSGDTVWIPPGAEHWHGAAPETGMVHIAMQEGQDGSVANWLEPVSDEDYRREPGS